MEIFSYKQSSNDFPKIISSNSTWYKTFNLNKTKNISMKNLKAPNLGNNIKSIKNIFQKKLPNTSQISKKIIKNKLRQNRPSSVIQQRISEEETDDSIFALSQIKNIDDKITKRVNKKLVWKEKTRKIYDINTSRNFNDIKIIRKKVYESRFECSKNFDLRNEIDKKKYFPIEKVDIINEATDIMKKMENEIKPKAKNAFFIKKRFDMQAFAKQNRDICLKNNLINLIKDEMNKLKIKEQDISKALEEANIKFNKDKELFEKFVIDNNEKIKNDELVVEEVVKNNIKLVEEIHKLNREIRSKQDEIERNIRDIILYYSYAEFIHRIIGNGKPLKKINIDKINIQQNRSEGRDIKYFVNNVFEQFDYLLNDNNFTKTYNFQFDSEQLTYLFKSMENAIMKLMKERDDLIKEINKNNHYSELNFLQNRLNEHKKEFDYLNKEMAKINNSYKSINDETKNELNQGQKYIFEIYVELKKIFGDVEINNNMEIIAKDTICFLHKLEDKLLFYIKEIENIQDNEQNELFRNALENVKIINKNKKIKQSKLFLKKLEEEKLLKYQKRMNRIKLGSARDYHPNWVIKKKKDGKKPKKEEGNKDDDLLYY